MKIRMFLDSIICAIDEDDAPKWKKIISCLIWLFILGSLVVMCLWCAYVFAPISQ